MSEQQLAAKEDRSTAFLRSLAAEHALESGGAAGVGQSVKDNGANDGATAVLREHIDQLTREAYQLRRGLTQQARIGTTI